MALRPGDWVEHPDAGDAGPDIQTGGAACPLQRPRSHRPQNIPRHRRPLPGLRVQQEVDAFRDRQINSIAISILFLIRHLSQS